MLARYHEFYCPNLNTEILPEIHLEKSEKKNKWKF